MKENNTTIALPSEWPGAFEIYKVSRDCVRKNLGSLVVLALLPIAVNIVISMVLPRSARVLAQLVSFFVGAYFSVVITRAYLLTARQKPVAVEPALTFPMALYWKMFLLELLIYLTVIGGFILLIVPGIIFAMRLYAAPYYLIDKNLGVMDAYKASWHATKGHLGKLWGLIGVAFLMLLPALTIIGVIFTIYFFFMFAASGALFYLYILKHQQKEA